MMELDTSDNYGERLAQGLQNGWYSRGDLLSHGARHRCHAWMGQLIPLPFLLALQDRDCHDLKIFFKHSALECGGGLRCRRLDL